MNRIRVVTLAIVAAAAVGCKDEGGDRPPVGPGSNPTSLVVTLTTPNGDDGALMFTVRGPEMLAVTSASSSYLVFSNLAVQGQARVIAVGDLRPGAVFTIAVTGAHEPADYTVSLEQVATRADALRSNLAGYKATVSAGPQ